MEYAIVYKNRVIVGPMSWSQKYFTDVLKIRHRVTSNIPGKQPNEMPFVINEDTKIHCVIDNKLEADSMIQCVHGPFWDLSSDIIVANYEIRDLPIETAKNNFKSVLAEERYRREVAGTKATVQELEISLDTSRDGRNVFVQKLMIMDDTETTNWKFPEGWLILTKTELTHIVKTGARHIQDSFNWESDLNNQINACTSLEELMQLLTVILPTKAESV